MQQDNFPIHSNRPPLTQDVAVNKRQQMLDKLEQVRLEHARQRAIEQERYELMMKDAIEYEDHSKEEFNVVTKKTTPYVGIGEDSLNYDVPIQIENNYWMEENLDEIVDTWATDFSTGVIEEAKEIIIDIQSLEQELYEIYATIIETVVDNEISLNVVRTLGDLYGDLNKKDLKDMIVVGGVRPGYKKKPRRNYNTRRRGGNRGQRGGFRNNGRGKTNRPGMSVSLTRGHEPFAGLPQIFEMKLRYVENSYQFVMTAGQTYATQSFALNDPWDPWVPLGGKSANEFYQIMAFYKYCRTNSATLKVTLTQPAFASNRNVGIAMIPNYDGDSYPNNIDDLRSMDPTRVTIVTKPTDLVSNSLFIKRNYKIPDIFNIDPRQYYTAKYSGLSDVYNSGSSYYSPTNLAKVEVMVFKFDENTSDAITAIGFVEIDFKVTFAQKYPQGEYTPLGLDELKRRSMSLQRKAYDEQDHFSDSGEYLPPDQCITIGSEIFKKV